jgi:uncharacterized protein (DUF608 family)
MNSTPDCSSSNCGCHSSLSRRDFLKWTSLATTGAVLTGPEVVAGPFEASAPAHLIPTDKKLDPAWVKFLSARGQPTVYRGAELEKIGMPVGGICAGQLYLGGDGKLWHWDIFNLPQPGHFTSTSGPNYAQPPPPESPLEQGFAIQVTAAGKSQVRRLDSRGFNPQHIAFRGQYPMAFVDYRDPGLPVEISLEAFSPFIPLNVADSSLPATVMRYTVKNTSRETVAVALAGWLENAVCLGSGKPGAGTRTNRLLREAGLTMLHCTAEPTPESERPAPRPEIVFEDFEVGYGKWTVVGEALGAEPSSGTLPSQQAVSGFRGKGLVNTFLRGDVTTGRLKSKPFQVERRCIAFLIGGGQSRQTSLNLLLDGKVVRTATGRNEERLDWSHWDVTEFAGREAQLEIVDQETGAWGHINVDQIVFTDTPPSARPLIEEADFGSLCLALLGGETDTFTRANTTGDPTATVFEEGSNTEASTSRPFGDKLIGAVGRRVSLPPGGQAELTFLVTWHFPRLLPGQFNYLNDSANLRKSYGKRFDSAAAVARYVATNFDRLAGDTRLWNRTWYDSTLPYWFLDRTFIPICTLATSTCYQFDNGRFYGFEGVYCCAGTCQHVWNYAQSIARIFPELERDLRQRTDFGTAWHENGAIDYRGEAARHVAHDGQCGVMLRAWREHQMAPSDAFLRDRWPRIRKSVEYLITCDADENGLLEGEQYNTLDASWWGPMAWISSFYIAALRAGEAMATEMGDAEFSARCRRIAERGSQLLVGQLFNGEYFIHQPDPKHPEGTNTNDGCHIDQLMGQAWALQVGLPRIVPLKESGLALEAIWKYNFAPDAGAYRNAMQGVIKGGRWYAMAGEGGVVMTTFPRGGAAESNGKGGFVFYFNEVWTGQEHQLAAHYLWEGKVDQALVVTRMVEDRHHAARRNPYNEVECSDHYTRAMSSHGTFIAACGFEYHGPKGHLGFAPRLTPENFRAPFTVAEGWGTYAQQVESGKLKAEVAVKWGRLRVKTLALEAPLGNTPARVEVVLAGQALPATLKVEGRRALVTLAAEAAVETGGTLVIALV